MRTRTFPRNPETTSTSQQLPHAFPFPPTAHCTQHKQHHRHSPLPSHSLADYIYQCEPADLARDTGAIPTCMHACMIARELSTIPQSRAVSCSFPMRVAGHCDPRINIDNHHRRHASASTFPFAPRLCVPMRTCGPRPQCESGFHLTISYHHQRHHNTHNAEVSGFPFVRRLGPPMRTCGPRPQRGNSPRIKIASQHAQNQRQTIGQCCDF